MRNLILIFLLLLCPQSFAAIQFDGTDDAVGCASPSSLDDISIITINAWINLSSLSNGYYYIVEKNNSNQGPEFAVDITAGVVSLAMWISGSTAGGYWTAPLNAQLNQWYMVTVEMDRSSVSNDPAFYVNGVLKTTTESTTPSGSFLTDAAENFNIGGSPEAAANWFPGKIREVSIHNLALSGAQLDRIYQHNGFMPSEYSSGLLAHWLMNDGADGTSADGDTISDDSGNGLNCTGNDGANNTGLTWRNFDKAKAKINNAKINSWK